MITTHLFMFFFSGDATAVLTGTAVGGITETNIVAGGRVITITLTGGVFIPN